MCTKLISFVCVLTLVLATTSYGLPDFDPAPGEPPTMLAAGDPDGGVLVGDWEQCMDHWTLTADDMGAMVGFSTVGITRNTRSLMWFTTAGYWGSRLQLKLQNYVHSDITPFDPTRKDVYIFGYDQGFDFDAWFAADTEYDTFEVDVTPVADTQFLFVFNYGGLNAAGGSYGGWGHTEPQPIVLAGVTTRCIWDFSVAKADWVDSLNNGYIYEPWVELMLVVTGDPTTIYVDNARLTPEPATIALLGLGGLSLLRIRRKR